MLFESTAISFPAPDESGLSEYLADWTQTGYFRPGWVVSKIVVAGLLVAYLAGWAQDLQRVRHLEAEPPPPFKVITKHEAWRLAHPLHPRPTR